MKYQTIGGNNKLDTILKDKEAELIALKHKTAPEEMEKQARALKRTDIRDLKKALVSGKPVTLIAEIKKASPSLGDINTDVSITDQGRSYESAGAQAISVLTDAHFKGEIGFLKKIREVTNIPVLRKDFIFDAYQVYESYIAGADALLLIASVLDIETLQKLVDLTHELGMECLVETHTREDLEKALQTNGMIIGINARNLQTFEVNLDTIIMLASSVPRERLLVAESGINSAEDVVRLQRAGAKAILVGTTLMQADNVADTIRELTSVNRI